MQTRTGSTGRRHVRWSRWVPYLLMAVLAAGGAAPAGAAPDDPAKASYRVIPLSADPYILAADINARGQVAFTEYGDGVSRAKFYDGRTLRDLGTFGGPSATAVALNDHGQVTGSATVNTDGAISHAYRWSQATGMVDLSANGQGNSAGADINNKGHVSGSAVFNPASSPDQHAFYWSAQTGMLDIGTLGAPFSFATAMNDAGAVAGYSAKVDSPLSTLGFRWTRAEGISDIGTLPDEFTLASDINAAGHIVGASPLPSGGYVHAFLWTPREGLTDLGTGTGNRSTAVKINNRGMVVGNVLDFMVMFHGFVWTRESGLIEIGAESAQVETSANDVNNRGQVVGSFGGHAYLWTRAQGVVDLNTRLQGAPEGLVLTGGVQISDNGAIVAIANTGLVLLVPRAIFTD